MSVRRWARDLAMGVRFTVTGGREGWTRALLTAVGVGLGVALLLLTTALPNALTVRHEREAARSDITFTDDRPPKGADTLIVANVDTDFRDDNVRGRALEAEGPRAPLPPGVERFPAPGEMVVSPALERLLASDSGELLRERLPERITGTIGESGLVGSHELAFYRGADGLAPHLDGGRIVRIDHFGDPDPGPEQSDPVLLLLILVVLVVLLMPVAVFIAAAVRFGGERRDRRLAALRLVGSDSGMTRRIAAGEALAGAVLGLVLGAGFFLVGRQLAGTAEVFRISVFPSYLNPSPLLALLVAVAVPAAAVLVTLFALRGVVIEPLGVVRTAKPARRRLWWRLLLPVAGLAMLYPMVGQGRSDGDFNQYLVTGGVVLLLVGVTALLPWIVETVVARLGAGAVSWQLAVRRLQLSSGTAARMVNGIAVAVAGAIALQMLFAGVDDDYTKSTGKDVSLAQMEVALPSEAPLAAAAAKFRDTRGVEAVFSYSEGYAGDRRKDAEDSTTLTVGDCASLREIATLSSCRDGDVFAVRGAEWDAGVDVTAMARDRRTLYLDPSYEGGPKGLEIPWKVPSGVKEAAPRTGLLAGTDRGGFLITPKALPESLAPGLEGHAYLRLDESVPDVHERVRNTAAAVDPLAYPMVWAATERSDRFDAIRTGLFVGAACVLALIGASLLVSQLEQLRERRKLLSALVAFGTRRRTLSLSVLWQTAIPIVLGLVLASVVGLTLGTVLLKMTSTPVSVDWTGVLAMTGIGAAVVLLVTLASLPPLLRLMRPEGLRTE
ncbi:Integral membrane protein [Streptomyces ambofaciens ATCC 23877]|uniref:Integral membrane protein n=1 Tax=Streptomyces ambofaciens (strain ATCC 23877 / 3486 / DSM 40053 / JCM 4204 / NBRC 12836 / NRRL B-2516) TaxID=278992 RepID=A0A0K2AY95_STRA7|nr:ABC transporter permease [Streptomyces ambofaciens]AKZ57881.1 Integral membrane protein [Streptomyces ambofaciens ATCC 23877]